MFLKICSFDIEVLTTENRMPSPDKDRIVLVSLHFNYDYEIESVKTRNVVLILTKNYENIEVRNDKIIFYVKDEIKIVNRTFEILKNNDVFTGYNINGFDFPYLIDRARTLGIKKISIGNGDSGFYYRRSLSKGFSVTKLGGSTGKIILDVLAVLRREDEANPLKKKYNLKILKLEHVSREILGIEKLEFSIKEMNDYWNDTDNVEHRNKFIDYCSRDSELALMFLTKFRLLDKFIALSKASGKLVQDVINALGSGGFVENMLLQEFRKVDRLMPIRTSYGSHRDDEEELKGAEVFEPKLGVTDNMGSADYKCCVGDTLVLTDNGFVKIKDMEDVFYDKFFGETTRRNPDIYTVSFKNGLFIKERIIDFRNIGIDKTKRITLEYGYEIEGSLNHRILKINNGSPDYVELKDLEVGDVIVINKGSNIYGNDVVFDYSKQKILDCIQEGRYGKKREIKIVEVYESLCNNMKIPNKVDSSFAEFFGYMVSDGYIGGNNSNWSFTQKDDEVFDKFVKLYDKLFERKFKGIQCSLFDYGDITEKKIEIDDNNLSEHDKLINKLKSNSIGGFELQYRYRGGHDVRVSSVDMKRLFAFYGFSGNSYEKEVPWCILQSSKECQCAFLMTLFEGDGCADKITKDGGNRLHYISKSKILCKQIQLMLLNMGIVSNLYYVPSSNDYTVSIHGYNVVLFYQNIGFVSSRKNSKLKNIVNNVMGYECDDDMKTDLDKISKKNKAGNRLYPELRLNEVLKRLHNNYINNYSHVDMRSDPSFFRTIYRYINDNDSINVMVLKKYLEIVKDKLGNDIDYRRLKWFVECDMIFLRVKSIDDGVEKLYDISVENTHNYVSNGFISHNSLYPSILIKYNLCYSTLLMEKDIIKIGLGEKDIETMYDDMGNAIAKFVRKEKYKGIIPRTLETLLVLRASQKKEMKKYEKDSPDYFRLDSAQNATKITMNSFYGYTGDADAKVYSWYIAASVTGNGRKQIKETKKMIEEEIGRVQVNERWFKLKIVLGDTDSSYINVISEDGNEVSRDETIKAVMIVIDKVNSTLEKPMQLDFEDYVKRIVVIAKKHYAKLTVDDNGKESITSKGIETVRRDWCNYSTDTMSKIIDYILKEKNLDDGIKKSVEIVKEQAKLLNDGKIDLNELVLSKKLTKPITYYDNKAVHVQVAIKMKNCGKPSEVGDRIQYIITDNGKKLVSEMAEEADYVIKNNLKVNNNFYLYHQLIPPAMRVLGLLGVKEEMLKNSLIKGQKNLFDY